MLEGDEDGAAEGRGLSDPLAFARAAARLKSIADIFFLQLFDDEITSETESKLNRFSSTSRRVSDQQTRHSVAYLYSI